ncbi:glutaredoxin [Methylacidiphilum caldifontis]|nr:glutaredoxin [Methylacidiphilum caldifontis]
MDIVNDMSNLHIVAYLKPSCGWSNGVRAILKKYNLPYEDKDIINFPEYREEMIMKSGQPFSPCVEVNGEMLADISGQELEQWLIAKNYVKKIDKPVDVPIDQACSGEHNHGYPVKVNFEL